MQREKPVSLDDVLTQRVEDAVVRALAVHNGVAPTTAEASTQGGRISYSMAEAAEMLGVGRTALYDLARNNELRTFKIGKRRLVTREALVEFLDKAQAEYEL